MSELRSRYDAWHQRVHDPAHDDALSPWYRIVSEYIGEGAGLQVLEVACGRGGFSRSLARSGSQVTGCDFSATALGCATEQPSGVTWVQGDAQRLPFTSNFFDVVVSCETIEHLPEVQAAVNEMYRVARPRCRLFLTTPNYANLMGLYEFYARFRHPHRKDDQPVDRRQWFPQIHAWLRRAGWTILST